MINRETIYKISAYLDSKRLSANKFGFQNLIKIEGGSFWTTPNPLRASPDAVIFTGSAHPNIKVKQASWKDARASEKHILSHQKLPVLL